ncbi:hypothetical protein D3C84_1010410 [compost metagenome]
MSLGGHFVGMYIASVACHLPGEGALVWRVLGQCHAAAQSACVRRTQIAQIAEFVVRQAGQGERIVSIF